MTASEEIRSYTRWPLRLAVGMFILTLLWGAILWSNANPYEPEIGETAFYWWLIVVRGGLSPPYAFLLTCGLIYAALLVAIVISGRSAPRSRRHGAAFLALGANIWASVMCFCMPFFYRTSLVHAESISYKGGVYQLTEAIYHSGVDFSVSSFLVFECDSLGIQCELIQKEVGGEYLSGGRDAAFFINPADEALYVRVDFVDEPILIAR